MQSPKEEFKRKRAAPDGGTPIAQPPKKQYTGLSMEEGNEVKGDPSLLRFQKRAMLVTLQERKEEIERQSNLLKKLQNRQEKLQETLSLSNGVWEQLLTDLHILMAKVKSPEKNHDGGTNSHQALGPRASFLQRLLQIPQNESEITRDEIEKVFQTRSEDTKKLLVEIVETIEKDRESISSLISSGEKDSSDGNLKALSTVNGNLKQENSRLQSMLDELHIKLKESSRESVKSQTEQEKLEERLKDLEEEMLDLKDELSLATRKCTRIELRHQEEVDQLKEQLRAAKEATPVSVAPQENNHHVSHVPADEAQKKLQMDLDDMKALAEQRLAAIERYQHERVNWARDLERLQREASYIPDERVMQTGAYHMLQQQLQFSRAELERSRALSEKYNRELGNYVASYRAERDKFEMNEISRREALEKDLRASESKIMKLTQERDKAVERVELMNANAPSPNLVKELREMIRVKDHELRKLREQVEKYREDSNRLKTIKEDTKKGQEKLVEALDEKKMEVKDLHAKLQAFQKSVDDLKSQRK